MPWTRLKLVLVIFLSGAVLLPFTVSAQELPPTRVAVVNFQNALLATDDMQARSKELESKYAPTRDELEKRAQELQDLQGELQSAAGAEARAVQSEIQRKQREAQRMQEDFQTEVEFDRADVLGAGARTMREVVTELARAKGLDLVVDVTNTLFVKPALDLSAEATAAYNQKVQAR
jgi:outer membrane protein